jgi:recombination protein RecA
MTKTLPDQVRDAAQAPPQQHERPIVFDQLVSTGSLLLDLAISGGVSRYGGIPGRIIVQVYGPNSTGKTTLMAEVLGHVQRAGGAWRVRDPEARLNASYCRTFGVKLDQDDIERTGTITDMFEGLIGPLETKEKKTVRAKDKAWVPDPKKVNIYAVDSLASLASRMEMEQGDKLGQKRAKDFSEGFRMISDHVYNHNIIMFCTDQVRDNVGGYGEAQKPGGGNAVGYYSSLRIRLKKVKDLVKEVQLEGMAKVEKHVYGIEVEAFIRKSSLDRGYRTASIRILFNYGLDDIGANLQWLKEHGYFSEPGYRLGDQYFPANTKGGALDAAIAHVEAEGLEDAVREAVVEVWNQIEAQVRPQRKPKER